MPARDALDVGAAAQRRRRSRSTSSPGPGDGVGDVLDAQVTRAVQQRGPHGVTITFMPSRRARDGERLGRGLEREAVRDQPLGARRRRSAISASASRVSRGPAE